MLDIFKVTQGLTKHQITCPVFSHCSTLLPLRVMRQESVGMDGSDDMQQHAITNGLLNFQWPVKSFHMQPMTNTGLLFIGGGGLINRPQA